MKGSTVCTASVYVLMIWVGRTESGRTVGARQAGEGGWGGAVTHLPGAALVQGHALVPLVHVVWVLAQQDTVEEQGPPADELLEAGQAQLQVHVICARDGGGASAQRPRPHLCTTRARRRRRSGAWRTHSTGHSGQRRSASPGYSPKFHPHPPPSVVQTHLPRRCPLGLSEPCRPAQPSPLTGPGLPHLPPPAPVLRPSPSWLRSCSPQTARSCRTPG